MIDYTKAPSAEEVAKIREEHRKNKTIKNLIFKFIDEEYVQESKKRIPKLVKKIETLKPKIARLTNEKSKAKANSALKELEAALQIEKMWELYYKYYVLCINSREKKDFKNYKIATSVLERIKARHKELTAKDMNTPEAEFSRLYAKKVNDFRNKK